MRTFFARQHALYNSLYANVECYFFLFFVLDKYCLDYHLLFVNSTQNILDIFGN
jgi:hypothetical protein